MTVLGEKTYPVNGMKTGQVTKSCALPKTNWQIHVREAAAAMAAGIVTTPEGGGFACSLHDPAAFRSAALPRSLQRRPAEAS